MQQLPSEIFRRWIHSFEEDSGDIQVYRPAEFAFPPARGRDGLELRPDGTFIEISPGRADAPQSITARWQVEPSGRIRISFPGSTRGQRILEIVQVDADSLRVRQAPVSP